MFFRNQGPKCEAPQTQNDPACSAIPDAPKGKLSGPLPGATPREAEVLRRPPKLEAGKKDKVLIDPFTVVARTRQEGRLQGGAVPRGLQGRRQAISGRAQGRRRGARRRTSPRSRRTSLAAAQAFVDDEWWPADEAWAKMDAKNSKYYLRIAPDEVYREPCSTKALFHVSFGLINQGSLKWQSKLDPLEDGDGEGARRAGRRAVQGARGELQAARTSSTSRSTPATRATPSGATIGQSLPNFGPVANEGRGRTVAMTNFYTDPDSIEALKGRPSRSSARTRWRSTRPIASRSS